MIDSDFFVDLDIMIVPKYKIKKTLNYLLLQIYNKTQYEL